MLSGPPGYGYLIIQLVSVPTGEFPVDDSIVRVTESGDDRLTESGDHRTTEGIA